MAIFDLHTNFPWDVKELHMNNVGVNYTQHNLNKKITHIIVTYRIPVKPCRHTQPSLA